MRFPRFNRRLKQSSHPVLINCNTCKKLVNTPQSVIFLGTVASAFENWISNRFHRKQKSFKSSKDFCRTFDRRLSWPQRNALLFLGEQVYLMSWIVGKVSQIMAKGEGSKMQRMCIYSFAGCKFCGAQCISWWSVYIRDAR